MNAEQLVRRKRQQLHKSLDERSRRLWAAPYDACPLQGGLSADRRPFVFRHGIRVTLEAQFADLRNAGGAVRTEDEAEQF